MASANENQAEQQAPHLTDEQANTRARSRRTDRRGLPSWLTIALVVLTCISLLASTMAVWVDATLLNTDRFVGVVGPLDRDPQAVASVSQYVADQVVALDIASRTASALPVGGSFSRVHWSKPYMTSCRHARKSCSAAPRRRRRGWL